MTHITKFGKRIHVMFISSMIICTFLIIFFFPFFNKSVFRNNVGYYQVNFDGENIGYANSREEVQSALSSAKKRLCSEYDTMVYMDPKVNVVKKNGLFEKRMSEEELKESIYKSLLSDMMNLEVKLAYIVNVGNEQVTLSSRDDVISLLKKLLAEYDTKNEFEIKMDSVDEKGHYKISIEKKETVNSDQDIVSAILNGAASTTDNEGQLVHNGITSIAFSQDITVSAISGNLSNVLSVNQAYDDLNSTINENKIYCAKSGDTYASVASDYNINADVIAENNKTLTEQKKKSIDNAQKEDSTDEDSSDSESQDDTSVDYSLYLLAPGEEIVIPVSTKKLTVVTTKKEIYEEDYSADPVYTDDNTKDRGIDTLKTEGVKGRRKVTAEVTYVNGIKNKVDIVEQNIIKEAKPAEILVGTLTTGSPYQKPVTTTQEAQTSDINKGADWYVPENTQVVASAGGKVIRASWYSGYGYCVDIYHINNTITRYANLNEISVTVGQDVRGGQIIGLSGKSGQTDEPKLHFEILLNSGSVNALNYVNKK